MPKHKKTGWYEHFSVLIFAQGTWKEKDRERVKKPIREKHDDTSENPYPFFSKLTLRRNPPEFADCPLCHRLYELFKEFTGPNDFILYQGHHYLIMEEDMEDMEELVKIILSNDKVKKIFILYIKGFSSIKTTEIHSMKLDDLKRKLRFQKYNYKDFLKILSNNTFEDQVVYQVLKY
ncbi:MAG TPA: hypothetical protein ENI29_06045 [bacterium]|nr:hypothetical protein [bacterium]